MNSLSPARLCFGAGPDCSGCVAFCTYSVSMEEARNKKIRAPSSTVVTEKISSVISVVSA
eukprot:scaffold23147_cov72-Skeletonema_dohrnii-CCMP3373.AAC.1